MVVALPRRLTKNGAKSKELPVTRASVGKSSLWMREVKGEWSEKFNEQTITSKFNTGVQNFICKHTTTVSNGIQQHTLLHYFIGVPNKLAI